MWDLDGGKGHLVLAKIFTNLLPSVIQDFYLPRIILRLNSVFHFSHSRFCPFAVLSVRGFVRSRFCPFAVLSVAVLSVRGFVHRGFVHRGFARRGFVRKSILILQPNLVNVNSLQIKIYYFLSRFSFDPMFANKSPIFPDI